MKRSTIVALIVTLGVVVGWRAPAAADGPNADVKALLASVAAAYRNYKSVSMTLELISAGETPQKTVTVTTKIALSKPGKLSAQLTAREGTVRVIADGKSIFTMSSSNKAKYFRQPDLGYSAIVQSLANSGGCGIGLLAVLLSDSAAQTKIIQGNPVYVRRTADATIDGNLCDVITTQSKVGPNLFTYTFAFAKSDHFLRRVTVSDPTRSRTPMVIENYTSTRVNAPISGSVFMFTPPKGAVAVDPTIPPPEHDARIKVGAAPIPITGTDLSGKPVSLAQYKGKVVLLDFWATWCGPCIHELPNVIAAYGKYHAQGFDVVGITLDKANSKQRVQQFISTNHMPWRQIYDGKFWSAANASAYGIHAIPFTLLVGKDGKVAAIGARGPALAPAIEAALNRK